MELAYPDVPVVHRRWIGLDTFRSTLGNPYRTGHLLVVAPDSVEAAVRAGNYFFQVKVSTTTHGQVRMMEEEDP